VKAYAWLILPLAACAVRPPEGPVLAGESPAAAQPEPPDRSRAAAAGHGSGFDSASAEREFQLVRGAAALERLRSAPTSVVAVFYQGLPRPITGPDGRVAFAGPAVNAATRERGRWLGWKTGKPAPLPADVAARLDSIVEDPRLWQEPEVFPRGACTDAGSLQLAIRHDGRRRFSRQDNCDSRGLSGELGRIVLGEALIRI
jgi:hypothetical protein